MNDNAPKTVLVIAGHDPSGGAGIQADIEAIRALGGFAATVITTLTVQDSRNVQEIIPITPELIKKQAQTILNDYSIAAIKIGLLGSAETALGVAELLSDYPDIPVVLDTVLAAGGGKELATSQLIETIMAKLMPHVTLTTPNSVEARRLTQKTDLDECAQILLNAGANAVLITGEHEQASQITNTLYQPDKAASHLSWNRLPGQFHGSGCTLASATAALLAQNLPLEEAVSQAQKFTWETLKHSYQLGQGQRIPNRLYKLK